jgi:dTDP-glucose pyrophosphorylase
VKNLSQFVVPPNTSLLDTIKAIDSGGRQIALIVDSEGRLLGTVTDGDIRRAILRGVGLDKAASNIMNTRPLTATPEQSIKSILRMMRAREIHQIPIVDANGILVRVETLDELMHHQTPDVWVVLMAGGLGARLRPITDRIPKPLLPVGGRPLLETIIENFASQGFTRVFISVNYKAEMLEQHFGDGSSMGVQIEYIREEEKMGTAGALSLLPEKPKNPIIVMNGDLLTTLNFRQFLDYHQENGATATMAVREYSFQVPYGVVGIENQRLISISEKPSYNFFVNAGMYVLEPSVLDLLPEKASFDMPKLFEVILHKGQSAAVFPIREYWMDIGRVDDLERAQSEFPFYFPNG